MALSVYVLLLRAWILFAAALGAGARRGRLCGGGGLLAAAGAARACLRHRQHAPPLIFCFLLALRFALTFVRGLDLALEVTLAIPFGCAVITS